MGYYSRTFADNPYQRAIRTSIFFIVRAVHRLRTYRTHFHLTLLNLPQLALDSGGRVLTLCLLASRLDTFLSFFRFSSSFSPLSPLVRGPLLSTHTHTLSLVSSEFLSLSSTLLFSFHPPATLTQFLPRSPAFYWPNRVSDTSRSPVELPLLPCIPKYRNILLSLHLASRATLIDPLSIHYQTRSPSRTTAQLDLSRHALSMTIL